MTQNKVLKGSSPIIASLSSIVIYTTALFYYHLHGRRFDASLLPWGWQYLDPQMLKTNLAGSLWNLHIQPPLYNLFLGVVLKVSAEYSTEVFAASSVLAGAVLCLSLQRTLHRLGAGLLTSLIAVLVLSFNPLSALYGSYLFYTWPIAALLMLSTLLLHRAVSRGTTASIFVFLLATSAVALTRAAYHAIWVFLAAGILLWASRVNRRRVFVAGAFPVAIVLALYAKNLVLFGNFGASSWFGMNLAKLTTVGIDPGELENLRRAGLLSPLATTLLPFRPLHMYPAEYGAATALTEGLDPALRTAYKATGAPNYNHLAYLRIAADYLRDDLTVLRRHPGTYMRSVGKAWVVYFIPGVDLELLGQGTGTLTQLYEMFLYGVPYRFSHDTEKARPMKYPLLETTPYLAWRAGWGWAILVAASCLWAMAVVFRSRGGRSTADRAVLAFMTATILYNGVVCNALELGENYRSRMDVEPLCLVLVILALGSAVRRLVRWQLQGR